MGDMWLDCLWKNTMSPSPPSGNNDEDDNNCEKFSDESVDKTISSLFVQESWLDNHEDSD
jgi:hypothetical protein